MSGLYRVFLKDLVGYGEDWGEGDAYVVGTYLKDLFDEVCQHSSSVFSNSDFWWDPNPGDLAAHELLVYILPAHGSSLIRQLRPSHPLGPGGTTLIAQDFCLSEVYRSAVNPQDQNPARGLAVLAFHELMHNKLKRGNILHTNGGGGIASATVYSNYHPNAVNKQLLAPALGNRVPQYTGGLA